MCRSPAGVVVCTVLWVLITTSTVNASTFTDTIWNTVVMQPTRMGVLLSDHDVPFLFGYHLDSGGTSCIAYAGTCAHGKMIAQSLRTQENHCGTCASGYHLRRVIVWWSCIAYAGTCDTNLKLFFLFNSFKISRKLLLPTIV